MKSKTLQQLLEARARPNVKRGPRARALPPPIDTWFSRFEPDDGPTVNDWRYDCWRLTLPLPPSANDLVTPVMIAGRGRLVKTRIAKAWVNLVKMVLARGDRGRPCDGPIELTVTAYVNTISRDLSNTLKQLEDGLKGHCWHDDMQVTHIDARKEVVTDGMQRIEVTIVPCWHATDSETVRRILKSKSGTKQ